ncbi:PucR family transcriptional regulator [Nocardioides gilvus]|uniref:PucR family transcriptional regulator n=1 Tax=Nocardioides gilvus TaxID=1735589 RepID=UPI001950B15B|nr:helix-turn-helix domain-containing protein [Nocardioides gilvus]
MSEHDALQAAVVQVAERLRARVTGLNAAMVAAIEEAIDELDDTELLGMMHASVEGNIDTIIHVLRNDIPLDNVQVPTAASEYALRLARADVGAHALRRAYHLASEALLSQMFTEVQDLDLDPDLQWRLVHHLSGWLNRYVDWVTRVVADVYEAEQQARLTRRASEASQLIQRVVDREPVGVEHFHQVTGYRLDQTHVGAVLWVEGGGQADDRVEDLRTLVPQAARALKIDGAHLFTPIDRTSAWVWFAGDHAESSTYADRLRRLLVSTPTIRVALGSPEIHVGGFRRTLEQATAVRLVANAGPQDRNQVVSNSDDGIAVVAMLARDLPATRRWLQEVLGPLAVDSEAAERTRETVRVFLRTGSYTDTSELLTLHRNTVKYRISKMEKERGRPLIDGRLDLELGLHVCQVLGSAVLQKEPIRLDRKGRRPGGG